MGLSNETILRTNRCTHRASRPRALYSFAAALIVALFAKDVIAGSLVVTSTSSAINGDISSPSALQARPGDDGISLPEAVAAANNALEPQTITFADALSDQTITPTFPLLLTRDGTTLAGPTTADGKPTLTLDGHEARQLPGFLYVLASDVTVKGFRFVGQVFGCISVFAGTNPNAGFPGQPRPRQELHNVVIENNLFYKVNQGGATVLIYMSPDGASANASINDVLVSENSFISGTVSVAANGFNCSIRGVVIERNTFVDSHVFIESAHGSGNRVLETRFVRNNFVGAQQRATVFVFHLLDPPPASSNLIDGTVIGGNVFSGQTSVTILGGGGILGGQDGVRDSVVSNTDFVNNVMSGTEITILGGQRKATGNRVHGVRFVNNTLIGKISIAANAEDGIGNEISDITVRNTIFDPNAVGSDLKPEDVSYSLISLPGYSGNGNKAGDPRFVNSPDGDFHLLPDSPAIDAGTAVGAPAVDIECRPRLWPPDMGAYEFGASEVTVLSLRVASGSGTVDLAPAGLDCGTGKSFRTGSIVRLAAKPSPGWVFAGWGGDPDCVDGTVIMSQNRRCIVTFAPGRRRAARH